MDQSISTREMDEKIAKKDEVIQRLTQELEDVKKFYRKHNPEHWKRNHYHWDE